jgi:hypothetical protein
VHCVFHDTSSDASNRQKIPRFGWIEAKIHKQRRKSGWPQKARRELVNFFSNWSNTSEEIMLHLHNRLFFKGVRADEESARALNGMQLHAESGQD